MGESSLKAKTVKGLAWSAVERFSAQGIQFVFNILIARILLPEDYGVVAMLGIFLAVSQTFIDSGFANALIRKQDRNEADYSTVFWFNVAVSVFFCALLWLTAPAIASFYKIPLLTKVTRIISVTVIINALRAVHETQLMILMDFKKKAIVSIVSVSVLGLVGLVLAIKGFGVWALVFQSLAASLTRTVMMWVVVKWRPKMLFSWKEFHEMFSFGSKLLGSGILNSIYNNLFTLVIGKAFTPSALGLYNRAESFATFPSNSLTSMVNDVAYPAFSTIQNEKERLHGAFKRLLCLSAYFVFPMMVGMAAIAEPLVVCLLTEKWSEMIIFLQIICFSKMWFPVQAINMNILLVSGHSDYYLKYQAINKIIGILGLIITIPFGLKIMCLGQVITSLIYVCISAYKNEELIGYGIIKQAKDLLPVFIVSVIMGAATIAIVHLLSSIWVKLFVGIAVGGMVYIFLSYLFNLYELEEVIDIVKNKKR